MSPGGAVFDRTDQALFAMGLCYTAISRCQSIFDLLLQKPVRSADFRTHANVLETVKLEYERLETMFPQRSTIQEVLQKAKRLLNNLYKEY